MGIFGNIAHHRLGTNPVVPGSGSVHLVDAGCDSPLLSEPFSADSLVSGKYSPRRNAAEIKKWNGGVASVHEIAAPVVDAAPET